MRRIGFIVVIALVLALVLGVALWSRLYARGPVRSVSFGPNITVTTDDPEPIALLLELQKPDGTVSTLAWAVLGTSPGDASISTGPGGLRLPASQAEGTVMLRSASGAIVTSTAPGTLPSPLAGPNQVAVGSTPDIVLFKDLTTGMHPTHLQSTAIPWSSRVDARVRRHQMTFRSLSISPPPPPPPTAPSTPPPSR
jgi:hypothetical protein